MGHCEVCGQAYHRPLVVQQDGREHVYDCFQCAIAGMAPACAHCGAKVIGHGMAREGTIYCWAGCADAAERGRPTPVEQGFEFV